MNSIGIIAEYNPFHNGHLYQIKKIKEKYKDSVIVLVLSGNFTQRGEVSVIDKFKKTKIALDQGIDLIVELPFPFATQSADYFSYGAVTILEKLKVDKLIFGSESNDLDLINEIVNIQDNEELDLLVRYYSKQGNNYPTALSSAIKDLTGKEVNTPNDLLGISYLKTIKENNYNIVPETILRIDNYHNKDLSNNISSATAIRKALLEGKDISNNISYDTKELSDLHFIEDYFDLLKYKILSSDNLNTYQTVSEGIDNLIKKEIVNCNTYEELINKLKSKRYTTNKLKRMLLHILVGFTKEKAKQFNSISYIRILGFNSKGQKYLNSIKKDIDIPIISKINKNKDPMLEFELDTTSIYALKSDNYKLELDKEYKNIIKGE